jgi:hypothetical protein
MVSRPLPHLVDVLIRAYANDRNTEYNYDKQPSIHRILLIDRVRQW